MVERVVASPLQGTVVAVEVEAGAELRAGQPVVIIESMKMEHLVAAECSGVVVAVDVAAGDTVMPGDRLVVVSERAVADEDVADEAPDGPPDPIRADLAEVIERHAVG